jgi:hypothetical protein
MPSNVTPQANDLVEDKSNHSAITGSSAAEKYYRYMLMKAKLEDRGDTSAKNDILQASSEREDIEIKILQRLVKITESSPEFAQIQSITGSSDRYEQARVLAETVYDKMRAEAVLSFYTPDKSVLEANFYKKTLASANDRNEKLYANKAANGTTVPQALRDIFASLVGGSPSRS